jgi:WD40 repeat protein
MSQLLVWNAMFCFSLILIACRSETLLPPLSNTPESIASSTALSTPELAQTTTVNAINNPSPIMSSTSPLSAELSLQERIKTSAVVFYTTQRGVEPFPLLAWPELTILNRPEFSDIYGKSDGTSPLIGDMLPQLNATGNFLIIPGLGGHGPDGPREIGAGTWLANLNTGDVRQLWPKGVATSWSPDGTQLAYIENDTLSLENVVGSPETVRIFTTPELWENFIAWSPNGQGIATISSVTESAPSDGSTPPIIGTVWLASPQDGSSKQLGETFPILPTWYSRRQFQWSPDGSALFVGIANPQRIVTLSGQQYLFEEGSEGLAWVPHQPNLLVQKPQGLFIINQQGQEIVKVTDQVITAWAFSNDGRYLAYSYQPGENKSPDIYIFELTSQKTIWSSSMPGQVSGALSLHWTPTDLILIIDDGDYKTPVWATAIESNRKIEILIEQGLLITVIPRPPHLSP